MSSTLDSQLKAALKNPSLSGFDAAKIALYELWEGEHARDGNLNEAEQKYLLDGLRKSSSENRAQYRNWRDAFDSIIQLKDEACITSLSAQKMAFQLVIFFRKYIHEVFIKPKDLDRLTGLVFWISNEDLWEKLGTTPAGYVLNTLRGIREDLRYFFFCRSLLIAAKQETGVNFTEDLVPMEQDVSVTLSLMEDTFEEALYLSKKAKELFAGIDCHVALKPLQPGEETEAAFRARLKQYLGEDEWVCNCKKLWLKETLQKMTPEQIEREFFSNPRHGKKAKAKIRALVEEAA